MTLLAMVVAHHVLHWHPLFSCASFRVSLGCGYPFVPSSVDGANYG